MLNIANIRKKWFIEKVEALKESGIPYTEIAARLDIRPQYLNSIKNSERGASEKLTLKLCQAFNINHNELLNRISGYEGQMPETPEINEPIIKKEGIDMGYLFPGATSAIQNYDDSMIEYPPGSILVLKQVIDIEFIVWGRNYYVETTDLGIIRCLQDGGENHVLGYSSNEKKYQDGRLVHEPVLIPKKNICSISLILGCVTKEFSKEAIHASPKIS